MQSTPKVCGSHACDILYNHRGQRGAKLVENNLCPFMPAGKAWIKKGHYRRQNRYLKLLAIFNCAQIVGLGFAAFYRSYLRGRLTKGVHLRSRLSRNICHTYR